MLIDLHAHSVISDGTETPAGVIESAKASGIDVIALTDHDSTAGWPGAAERAREIGVTFVGGMEISCKVDGVSVHLLSYLHDPDDGTLAAEVDKARWSRRNRAAEMVERLSHDYPITWDDVAARMLPGAAPGRPHIADALIAAGVVADRSAAFAGMLSPGGKYYATHYGVDPVRAVRLVRSAGGVPVMAHPMASSRGRVVGRDVIEEMVDAGLAGLEIEHRDNPPAARRTLSRIAEDYGLIATGSSDYHGDGKPNRLGENTTDPEAFAAIEAAATGTAVVRG